MDNIAIQDIKVFVTAPRGINLVIVKVETSEPELFGYGCATFTQRYKAVVTAIEKYLCPMLKGRSVYNIEGVWQTMMGSSHWCNGPILNNTISGVDKALWGIKGRLAGVPLYSLPGRRARGGVTVYRHASGGCLKEVEGCISRYIEEGCRHIRCHMGTRGGNFDGRRQQMVKPEGAPGGTYFHPKMYMSSVIRLFEQARKDFGWEPEVIHDVYEWLSLTNTLASTRELEPFKLSSPEDSLAPGQIRYYKYIRGQTAVSFAMGELFTNPTEWKIIIQNQWIDFIRVHLSDIGGTTPAVKLTHFRDAYGMRTAWYGPDDLSPIGICAQMHLDLNNHNFGIQKFPGFTQEEEAVFPGYPKVRGGYAYVDDTPGIGVGSDERGATKYPAADMDHSWLLARLPDGTIVRPQDEQKSP